MGPLLRRLASLTSPGATLLGCPRNPATARLGLKQFCEASSSVPCESVSCRAGRQRSKALCGHLAWQGHGLPGPPRQLMLLAKCRTGLKAFVEAVSEE